MLSKAIGHIYQVGIKYIENIKFVWDFKSNKKFLFLLLLIDPVLYVFNKIDALWIEELDILDRLDNVVPSKCSIEVCRSALYVAVAEDNRPTHRSLVRLQFFGILIMFSKFTA